MYGTCPDAYASAVRAELWGILGVLRYAFPPLSIGTDNAEVAHGRECGLVCCGSPAKEGADIWKQIWAEMGDIGREGVRVYRIKGRLKKKEVETGRMSWCDWKGNDEADWLARKGAATQTPNEGCDRQLKRAVKFYTWATEFTNAWPSNTARARRKKTNSKEANLGRAKKQAEGAVSLSSTATNPTRGGGPGALHCVRPATNAGAAGEAQVTRKASGRCSARRATERWQCGSGRSGVWATSEAERIANTRLSGWCRKEVGQ